MAQELQQDPLSQQYPTMFALVPQCLVQWRRRYRGNRSLWLRLFNKERVLKEFLEAVPIMDAVYKFVQQQPERSQPEERLTVIDLASGKGYLSMFLCEMLPPSKVRRFVLMDKQWPMHGTIPQPHHMSWEHIYGTVVAEEEQPSNGEDHDVGSGNSDQRSSPPPLKYIDTWPIPITTSKQDLKHGNQRRNLEQTFFRKEEGPVILLAVHLCGTLSLKAVNFFNDNPDSIQFFALKPCCLPGMIHAKRHEVFNFGDYYSFDSKLVCVPGKWIPGKWNKDKWCGPNRGSMARTFDVWSQNLFLGINDQTAKKAKVNIQVQHDGGYQNEFLFAERLPATKAVWDGLEAYQPQEPIPTCVLVEPAVVPVS